MACNQGEKDTSLGAWVDRGQLSKALLTGSPKQGWKAAKFKQPTKGILQPKGGRQAWLPPEATRSTCFHGSPSLTASWEPGRPAVWHQALSLTKVFIRTCCFIEHFIYFWLPPPLPISSCYLKFVSCLAMGDSASNQHFPRLIASLQVSPWTCHTQTHTFRLTCHKKNCSFQWIWVEAQGHRILWGERDGGATGCRYSLHGVSKGFPSLPGDTQTWKEENSPSQKHHSPKYVDNENSLWK